MTLARHCSLLYTKLTAGPGSPTAMPLPPLSLGCGLLVMWPSGMWAFLPCCASGQTPCYATHAPLPITRSPAPPLRASYRHLHTPRGRFPRCQSSKDDGRSEWREVGWREWHARMRTHDGAHIECGIQKCRSECTQPRTHPGSNGHCPVSALALAFVRQIFFCFVHQINKMASTA